MADPDFNLLIALDALLAEGSVTGAAARLDLSVSAMSRTVKRLREVTGDPLLVRAGRGLVPTPHAETLRARAHETTRDVRTLLAPSQAALDLETLETTFTLRTNAAFVEFFGTSLIARVRAAAPRARLCFLPKPSRTAGPLRRGDVDLEIGRIESLAPEIRTRPLFEDWLMGVVRRGHPGLSNHKLSAAAYAGTPHIAVSTEGIFESLIDETLADIGQTRRVVCVVPAFADALRIAQQTDLVATVPRSCLGAAVPHDGQTTSATTVFELPVTMPSFTIRLAWHPRTNADPSRRWLRELIVSMCRQAYPPN